MLLVFNMVRILNSLSILTILFVKADQRNYQGAVMPGILRVHRKIVDIRIRE